MLVRLFLIVCFLVANSICVNHTIFKNCSRVPLCKDYRYAVPSGTEIYGGIYEYGIYAGFSAYFYVYNQEGSKLRLSFSLLEDDTYRLTIAEDYSPRAKLNFSLAGEPTVRKTLRVTINDDNSYNVSSVLQNTSKVIVRPYPLLVDFLYNDVLHTRLNGSRLLMDPTRNQTFAFEVTFPGTSKMYGLHEHGDHLALRQTAYTETDPYRFRNSDTYAWETNSTMALYGAVPVLYAHGNRTTGIFLHNAAEQWIDIDYGNNSAYFMVDWGYLDLFVMLGPDLKTTVRQYTALTGVSYVPPLWSLGYHQSRNAYSTQEEVETVVANFDLYDFPLDCIWLDYAWADGGRYFLWDLENFPNPEGLLNNISATGRKVVAQIDAFVRQDEDYFLYNAGLENGYFIKNPDNTTYIGSIVGVINASFTDFLNPDAREYYENLFLYENFNGTTPALAGIWNDMNEPAVYDVDNENTIPFDSLHYWNWSHRVLHNIYGHLHAMSTNLGLQKRDGDARRPFVLTRAHFAGTQRYAAYWTGDNVADWPYIAVSYSMCLTSNLLGIPFCGADIGGFVGNPDEELLTRWYQAALWLPFMRQHSDSTTDRREPYLLSNATQENIREVLRMRYKHLPVWYTLFYEHNITGDPVVRPLVYQYPDDENTFSIDDQLLVGPNIMAKAIYEPNVTSVNVYFPGDEYWYQITGDNMSVYEGGSTQDITVDETFSPVFYRSGSIIPRIDTERSSSADTSNEPYRLYIMLDDDLEASGNLFLDDFESFAYMTNGTYEYIEFHFKFGDDNSTSLLNITTVSGNGISGNKTFEEVVVLRPSENDEGRYQTTYFRNTSDGTLLFDVGIRSSSQPVLLLFDHTQN